MMNRLVNRNDPFRGRRRQLGGLTLFTAVLTLLLMTLMLFYASRIGLFEQRISANDTRQKVAFGAAEAMLDQASEYLLANSQLILSSGLDVLPDAAGNLTRDGWFATGLWQSCTASQRIDDTHPCGGAIAPVPNSTNFYYYANPNTGAFTNLPLDTSDLAPNSTARVTAIICFVNLATGVCDDTPPPGQDDEADLRLVLNLLAYGYADCTDTTDPATCEAEATISQPISTYSNFSGSPAVPLVTKSTFPPTGTAEIVGNPNGGGVGVPLTTWVNDNPLCSPATNIEDSGTWQTCEFQEWYHVEDYPDSVECTDNNCFCGYGGNNTDYFLSWKNGNDTNVGIDIVIDDTFPCDLFEFYFNVPRALYSVVKSSAKVLSDCSSIGPASSGLHWISGAECSLNSNLTAGSPQAPIILVSAATDTVLAGGVTIHGILYIFDGEDANADIRTLGTSTVYGSVIVDAAIDQFQGTFQIVYAAGVLSDAAGIGGVGALAGGWRDFGLPEIDW